MKFPVLLVLSALSLSAFAQHGQPGRQAAEVCNQISRTNSANASACAEAISRAPFDSTVVEVGYAVAVTGYTSHALRIMQISGGKYLDDGAAEVCIVISKTSPSNAASCVEASLDQAFEPVITNIALTIANLGYSSSALQALSNGKNAAAHPNAGKVCEVMAKTSPSNAAACVAAIINKDYFNGSENVCLNIATTGYSSSALTCLQNSGVETQRRANRRWRGQGPHNGNGNGWNPGNGQGPLPQLNVLIPRDLFDALLRSARKAQSMNQRGSYRDVEQALNELNQTLDQIRNSNGAPQRQF